MRLIGTLEVLHGPDPPDAQSRCRCRLLSRCFFQHCCRCLGPVLRIQPLPPTHAQSATRSEPIRRSLHAADEVHWRVKHASSGLCQRLCSPSLCDRFGKAIWKTMVLAVGRAIRPPITLSTDRPAPLLSSQNLTERWHNTNRQLK